MKSKATTMLRDVAIALAFDAFVALIAAYAWVKANT
jgi:hypothetical protein